MELEAYCGNFNAWLEQHCLNERETATVAPRTEHTKLHFRMCKLIVHEGEIRLQELLCVCNTPLMNVHHHLYVRVPVGGAVIVAWCPSLGVGSRYTMARVNVRARMLLVLMVGKIHVYVLRVSWPCALAFSALA